MGSGNSSPVKRVETVETEAHQYIIEMRFDHMAVGGTAILLILLILALYWLCRRRRSEVRRRRGTACCHMQQMMPMWSMMPQMLPAQYPPMMPLPNWTPMDYLRNTTPNADRFTELCDTRNALRLLPAKPPPPRGLPSPRSREDNPATA